MITCLMVSHNKPEFINLAINSLINQTYQSWKAILVDSGELYDKGFFNIKDNRITLVRSEETQETRKHKAMAPWCFNKSLSKIENGLITYLCDDDLFYCNAFEVFVNYYLENNADAMYASQDTAIVDKKGNVFISGERRATPRVCGQFNCQVDYLQFCHTRRIASGIYWPEEKSTENHADGVFMERIAAKTKVHPIDIKIGQNRRTPKSTYGASKI